MDLYGNQITQLNAGVFVGLSKLKRVWFNYNLLSALPNGIFQDSLNLERLFLAYNQIKYLDADALVGLSKLKQLRLNDNLLSTLPNGIFRDLTSLQLLLLQRNNLTYLSGEIPPKSV